MSRKILLTLETLRDSYKNAQKFGIDLHNPQIALEYSYEDARKNVIVKTIPTHIALLKKMLESDEVYQPVRSVAYDLERDQKNIPFALSHIDELITEIKKVRPNTQTTISAPIKSLPLTIRDELCADVTELQKAFNAQCYRSAVILCGRILEVALHAKYFEKTGQDILEKNPGIGLGNLLAKMREQNIFFDPGLSNQIHLINLTRVFCVHKKQDPFQPSRDQAHATILYTIDTLKKLFV